MFHFSVKYKFGTKNRSNFSEVVFMYRFSFFILKTDCFLSFHAFLKRLKLKGTTPDICRKTI